MPRRPLWRKLGTGFRAVEDMADAVRVRRVQARFVVIEIERALRFEPDESLADGPILRSHLQVTYLEGVHDSMHVLIQAGLLDFDGNPGRMGIRHEMHALTLGVEMPQKLLGMRQKTNHIIEFLGHRDDIDAEGLGPIMQIGPVEFALYRSIEGKKLFTRVHCLQSVLCCIAPGEFFFKKEIIEVAVQERPIHVQQNVVYLIPV